MNCQLLPASGDMKTPRGAVHPRSFAGSIRRCPPTRRLGFEGASARAPIDDVGLVLEHRLPRIAAVRGLHTPPAARRRSTRCGLRARPRRRPHGRRPLRGRGFGLEIIERIGAADWSASVARFTGRRPAPQRGPGPAGRVRKTRAGRQRLDGEPCSTSDELLRVVPGGIRERATTRWIPRADLPASPTRVKRVRFSS